jgi:hypothetical protein
MISKRIYQDREKEKARFIRTPLKGETTAGGCTKEHDS